MSALSRWPWWRRWFGQRSERAAVRFVRRLGYRLLTCNYSCPGGELDLVALEDRTLVFIEVRSTATGQVERTTLSITPEKQRRIIRAATHFLHRHKLQEPPCRFDVLIIDWPPSQKEPTITHHRSAFDA